MSIMAYHQNDYDYDSQSQYNQPCLYPQSSLSSVPSFNLQPQWYDHRCLATFQGHTSYISCLAISGEFLYSGSLESEIRAWKRIPFELDCKSVSNNLMGSGKGSVKSLVVLDDKLFTAHQDHKIRVWKINNPDDPGQQLLKYATLPTFGDRASKILLPKNQVRIRRHKTCTWVHHVDTVSALAISTDESLLYSVSWDRTLKIWRTKDFKCLESITNAHDDAINALALSKEGIVYTGSADKKIKVWSKNSSNDKHSLISTLEKHSSGINALALSNDGSELYSGSCDRSIVVWEKDTEGSMTVTGKLRGHTQSILCLVVVSDLICSGSADKSIRVWRGIDRNYSCLAILEGHKGPVKCLTAIIDCENFTETSCVVYSGSLDCDIRVWQVKVPHL